MCAQTQNCGDVFMQHTLITVVFDYNDDISFSSCLLLKPNIKGKY